MKKSTNVSININKRPSRGRPRKTPAASSSTTKRPRGRPRKTDTTTTKRPRGRPRKTPAASSSTTKRPRGRPRKTDTTTTKRPRGRPRKTDTTTTKRPRGRPRKTDTTTTKRPRGRPRKTDTTTQTKKSKGKSSDAFFVGLSNLVDQIRNTDLQNTSDVDPKQPKHHLTPQVKQIVENQSSKINKTALNKTLKKIDGKIAKVLKYYVADTDKKEIKSITDYLISDIESILVEDMESNQRVVYKKFSKQLENKIVKGFQDIDIVKHVCYENSSRCDFMEMIVVHDHKNYSHAYDLVYDVIHNIERSSYPLYIELNLLTVAEVNTAPELLAHTTTVFTR